MLASIIEGVRIDALIYNLDNVNQTAEVTSNPDSYVGDIIIPSSVEYNEVTYSVTRIGRIAFYGCSSLTSITIPNSIISIGNQAFEDCQSLTSVFIPSSVASIGENVFPWGIRRNEMSVDITNPYYDSRDNCNAIIETATNKLIAGCNSTIIPSSVTIIASGAFDGCYELASVTIPAGVTQIEGRGFAYCTSLKSINIPASVVSIGYFAFDGCSGLTSITVDENNPNYDSRDNCNALIETASNTLIAGCKNTIIPNGISKIEIAAFEECYGLKSIVIPNSVTYIGNSAFQECKSLTSISIPNSVMDMGPYTFCECYALEEIVLSNNITKIESGLFHSCYNLSSIVIPSNVTSIDDKAFYYCKNLTQIVCENVFPPEIAGENVFYEVDKSIPLYVPAQSVEAYRAADGWKEFTNIQPICPIAYGTCGAQGDNLTWELSCEGGLTIKGTGAMSDYLDWNSPWREYKDSIKSVIVEEGVTSIGYAAFRDHGHLQHCSLPSTIESIGEEAFCFCFQLMSIEIPDACTWIGTASFNLVPNVVITDESILPYRGSARSINGFVEGFFVYADETKHSLRACSSAASGEIVLDDAIEQIEYMAFTQCEEITNIQFGSHLQYIGEWSLNGCIGLESLSFQEGLIGIASNAFGNCFGLRSVSLPNSLTTIGDFGIGNCPVLRTIHFGDSLTSVGTQLFDYCPAIDTIYAPMTTPPVLGEGAFAETTLSNVTCYVPYQSLSLYQQAPIWKEMNLQPSDTPESCIIASGTCGDNLTWELSCDSMLTISGTGEMADWDSGSIPWYWNKSSIKYVVIENGVSSIGAYSFSNCSNIVSIEIPNSVERIGNLAFLNCSSLLSLTIPDNVSNIEYSICPGCTSLTQPVFNAEKFVYMPRTYEGAYTVQSGIATIVAGAFSDCTKLTSIDLSNRVSYIGDGAFSNCTGLTTVIMGTYMVNICNSAFSNCKGLTSITCTAKNPPYIVSSNSFLNVTRTIPVYVPFESVNAYKSADVWKDFTNIQPIDGSQTDPGHPNNPGTYQLSLNASVDGAGVLTGAGMYAEGAVVTISAEANAGYTFTQWSDGVTSASRTITMIARDTTLTAQFSVNSYQLTYKVDGEEYKSESVAYGATITPIANPEKVGHTFSGWSEIPATMPAHDVTITGTFTINKYTITFVDEDGTTVLKSSEVEYGATPTSPADPTKAATAQYTYTFAGWSPEIVAVTGEATYTATYNSEVNKYTITFVDEDGTTVLKSSEVEYGMMPVVPADPIKAVTEEYSFAFAGWVPEIVEVTAAATYTATYNSTLIKTTISDAQDLSDLPVGEDTHVIVTEEGDLTVSEPTTIGTITVTVSGDEASQITGIDNLTVNKAEMILRLEPVATQAVPNKWYAFAVPFEVEVSGGIFAGEATTAAVCNSAFVLDEYDGNLRATTQDGWKRVAASATLQPGVLYMIAPTGTTNEWRFVKRASAPLAEAASLSVAAYPSTIGDHHAGWNGVANTLFHQAQPSLDGVQHVTTYNNALSVYKVEPMSETVLATVQPFFVQAPQAGTILFAQPSGVAARYLQAADEPLMSCVLSLSSDVYTDKAYLSAQTDKENVYTIGRDLVKMQSASPSVPQLWLEAYNNHLAAYELPYTGTTAIVPLGMYAPQAGEYSLNANVQTDAYTLTLLYQDSPLIELKGQPLTLTLEQGDNQGYALSLRKKADIVTDVPTVGEDAKAEKLLINGQLLIIRDGKTYTVQGTEAK